jgi:hypothetical protein
MNSWEPIRQAIQDYYGEPEWLLLMLRQQWQTLEYAGQDERTTLHLNETTTVDLLRYDDSTVIQVYQGQGTNWFERDRCVTRVIACGATDQAVRADVHSLLKEVLVA